MRTASFYTVWTTRQAKCPECGKMFDVTPEWALYGYYHKRRENVCSYSCVRANEKSRAAAKAKKRKQAKIPTICTFPDQHKVTEQEKACICELYMRGYSASSIKDATGRAMCTVYNVIQERFGAYLPIKQRGEQIDKYR